MKDIITKKELETLIGRLENGVDKFILAGLFYGLNGADHREQLLNITSKSVNLEESTIILPSGKKVVMDELLKEAVTEAMNQKIYVKMGSQGNSNEDYIFNSKSEYVIKVKPTKRNNNGTEPLTNAGFKSRIRAISEFLVGDTSITPSYLKQSGAYYKLKKEDKKWTVREAEDFLKENGLSIRRNNLIPMLKEINGGINT